MQLFYLSKKQDLFFIIFTFMPFTLKNLENAKIVMKLFHLTKNKLVFAISIFSELIFFDEDFRRKENKNVKGSINLTKIKSYFGILIFFIFLISSFIENSFWRKMSSNLLFV